MRRDGKVQEERVEWERLRWAKFMDMQMNPHIKKERKPKTPKEWMRFEWEKEDKKKQPMKDWRLTDKEREGLQKIFNRKRG